MKHQIVWVHEESATPTDGFLDHGDEWVIGVDEEGFGVTEAKIEDVTLARLADACDADAESRNNHSFVGAHRILAAILDKTIPHDEAVSVMWEIFSYGGLDYASGCGIGNHPERAAWADLGIPEPWHEWTA